MEVLRAKTAGFCMGVGLALRKLDNLLADAAETRSIYTFGPLIHNPQVIEEYAAKGVHPCEDCEVIEPGALVLIRAHGVPVSVYERLRERGVGVADATCPKVKKAQELISGQAAHGRTLLLYGEENHPEVRGLLSRAPKEAVVFESLDELRGLTLQKDRPYFLAAQTTQDEAEFERIKRHVFETLGTEIPVLPTICHATTERQQEAIAIARTVDYMVVVGGHNSGNTRRLVKVAEAQNTPCVQIETAADLDRAMFGQSARIGLTAGASTPKRIIDEVESFLASV